MRMERDSMGEMPVPDDALWGASTQRAVLNFPVSGHTMPTGFVRSLGLVKWACARANADLGVLDAERAGAIAEAALEVHAGVFDAQFPIDVFQTGSGTSTNMNANEVIANRVAQRRGEPVGSRGWVHPNDHVNLGQSSNDIVPAVLHLSTALALRDDLVPALEELAAELHQRATEWAGIIKIGRTHLMDAVPLTLGDEFGGYAAQVTKAAARCRHAVGTLSELAVGGTAVGTGLNSHPRFGETVCRLLAARTGLPLREAANHFEAQAARDDCVEVAGVLRAVGAALAKIANDIRLLASGPRCGIGEITVPPVQPGSSIMPGKSNPVMSEMLLQAGIYADALCGAVAAAGREGHFELNATLPLMAHCLHESIRCLASASRLFRERCVAGLRAEAERCRELVERSLMLVTALTPLLGYDKAAHVAHRARAEGKTLREIVLEEQLLPEGELARALAPAAFLRRGAAAASPGSP